MEWRGGTDLGVQLQEAQWEKIRPVKILWTPEERDLLNVVKV